MNLKDIPYSGHGNVQTERMKMWMLVVYSSHGESWEKPKVESWGIMTVPSGLSPLIMVQPVGTPQSMAINSWELKPWSKAVVMDQRSHNFSLESVDA